jgi:hypothetical protein
MARHNITQTHPVSTSPAWQCAQDRGLWGLAHSLANRTGPADKQWPVGPGLPSLAVCPYNCRGAWQAASCTPAQPLHNTRLPAHELAMLQGMWVLTDNRIDKQLGFRVDPPEPLNPTHSYSATWPCCKQLSLSLSFSLSTGVSFYR